MKKKTKVSARVLDLSIYVLRIVISLAAFWVCTTGLHKIPMKEFLLYGPMLLATCLSVPFGKSKSKADYMAGSFHNSLLKTRFLEIERIRQVAMILANVGFNSRSFAIAIRFTWSSAHKFPTASAHLTTILRLLGFGVQNVILMSIGDSAILFDQ